MASKELSKDLQVLLADAVTMYFSAHGYHWNVEGPDFSQYHDLFAQIYEDVYSSIDPIAEDIRKIGDYAPFALSKFISLRTIDNKGVSPEPKAMAKALLVANEGVLASIDKAFKAAIKENEQGIANFLAERNDQHMKWKWQLTASIK